MQSEQATWSCEWLLPDGDEDPVVTEAKWGAGIAAMTVLNSFYSKALTEARAAVRRVKQRSTVDRFLVISDPELQARFCSQMARDSLTWRTWGNWSWAAMLLLLYWRPLLFVSAENQLRCLVPEFWPCLLSTAVGVVQELRLIDLAADIRRWWWMNAAKHLLLVGRAVVVMASPVYLGCLKEQIGDADTPCWFSALLICALAFASQLWCPLGLHLAAVVAPLEALGLSAALFLGSGDSCPYGTHCQPLGGPVQGVFVGVAAGTVANALIQHTALLRFLSREHRST